MITIQRSNNWLKGNNKRVIPLYLSLPFGSNRIESIIRKIIMFSEAEVDELLSDVLLEFENRHRDIKKVFIDHFKEILIYMPGMGDFSENRKLLTGAYFTKEYSVESAALFNPSMVEHPDQSNVSENEKRFILSLRSTGEGHISSISFQTGRINSKGELLLEQPSKYTTKSAKESNKIYSKDFILERAKYYRGVSERIPELLPDKFTESELLDLIQNMIEKNADAETLKSIDVLKQIIDTNYNLNFSDDIPFNERVIFPNAKAEAMGMEDVRFVKFSDNGHECYYGTYTAYNGAEIRSQLIETEDFTHFRIRSLYGDGIKDKGMALFPRKIAGKYVMISRQGGRTINIMHSNDIYHWENWQTLIEPQRFWETVQLGNCGSPIETEKGWLLITHAVGPMRKYVISAALLDLNNPSKVLSTLDFPLIEPNEKEREGYVPNVVYSCGAMKNQKRLIIPYAMSDSASGFAAVLIDDLLNSFKM